MDFRKLRCVIQGWEISEFNITNSNLVSLTGRSVGSFDREALS